MTTGRDEVAAGILPASEPGFQPGGEARDPWWRPAPRPSPLVTCPLQPITDHWSLITLSLLLVALVVAGCASPNVNPVQARARTGYVDFYADSSGELSWQVACFDGHTQSFKSVFSEFEPPPGRALRLAFPPGHYRLRVTFMNRVVREPGLAELDINDGLITPVHVVLIPDGTTQVETKETRIGGTFKGRYGRGTKFGSDESTMYRVSAEAKPSVPYQVKEQMPYAR